jgi:hypothetical protein
VNAVCIGASLALTIGLRRRRTASAAVSGVQTMPLVWRTMKAIRSGVASEAAMIRSPSFSRSSSSTTITISPRRIASIAASIVLSSLIPSHPGQSRPSPPGARAGPGRQLADPARSVEREAGSQAPGLRRGRSRCRPRRAGPASRRAGWCGRQDGKQA